MDDRKDLVRIPDLPKQRPGRLEAELDLGDPRIQVREGVGVI
jgi:hypothetical protein